ncbi:hypothetical protein IQ277_35405 [Nostocales cyanobacterium LEGE 12452]|nr:hypothetical protein [Nostocales cyanobacterium LEGE 12452]
MATVVFTLHHSKDAFSVDTDLINEKNITTATQDTSNILLENTEWIMVDGSRDEVISKIHTARAANGEWATTEW